MNNDKSTCPVCQYPDAKVLRRKGEMVMVDCPKCKKISWSKEKTKGVVQ